MLEHLIKALFNEFKREMNGKPPYPTSIHINDRGTKLKVLDDQFAIYFREKDPAVMLDTERYLHKILQELKQEYKNDAEKTDIVEEIIFTLHSDANKKKINSLLMML